jgi:hypothetical protein
MIGVLAIMFILVESLLEDLSLQCLSVLLLELILLYLLQLSISRYNFKRDKKLIEKQHQESYYLFHII